MKICSPVLTNTYCNELFYFQAISLCSKTHNILFYLYLLSFVTYSYIHVKCMYLDFFNSSAALANDMIPFTYNNKNNLSILMSIIFMQL